MEKIITSDGSVTFKNLKFDEAYHSITIGAIEEAKKKYVEPANIKSGMVVLDFCFGLGYNTLAALEKTKNLTIVALENDQEILDLIETTKVPDEYAEDFKIIRIVAKTHEYSYDETKIRLILTDAAQSIHQFNDHFDAVLFDPFSPKKCPELWSEEVFKAVFKSMRTGGILTTYSCARIVRDNLKAAGFIVQDGPTVGRRSPGTVAIKPCN